MMTIRTPSAISTLNGLAQCGCFRRGEDYISRVATKHGLGLELLRREAHEYARNLPITALVVALQLKDQPAP